MLKETERSVFVLQVMETKNMIYIVSEYASQGEIFGEFLKERETHTDIGP